MKEYQTTTYKIADIKIRLHTPWKEKISRPFQPFVTEEETTDWQVYFRTVEKLQEIMEKPLFSNEAYAVYEQSPEVFVRYFHNDRPDGTPYAATQIDLAKKLVRVNYLPEERERFGEDKLDFFTIGLEKIFMEENAAVLHAACVDTPYGGILFSGHSGAGKSTQADLWCGYGEGRLINGDRPVVKRDGESWYAYGSPYAGSSNCHLPERCQIRAIVLPRQAKYCALRKVIGMEAFREVFKNLTMNLWDQDFVTKAGNMALQLVSEIPVYELECTKEKEAVLVLKELLEKEYGLNKRG